MLEKSYQPGNAEERHYKIWEENGDFECAMSAQAAGRDVERLDASTKKILFENRRMAEELRLQVQETDELQKAKRYLEEENKKLKREVQLNEQSVKEYAKQGFRQSREIKELGGKVKTLERSLGTTTREHEKEKQGLVATDRRKIAEMGVNKHWIAESRMEIEL